MKMSGYNGSQLWDTAFTVQAYVAADVDTAPRIESLKKAHTYIQNTQARTPQTIFMQMLQLTCTCTGFLGLPVGLSGQLDPGLQQDCVLRTGT